MQRSFRPGNNSQTPKKKIEQTSNENFIKKQLQFLYCFILYVSQNFQFSSILLFQSFHIIKLN